MVALLGGWTPGKIVLSRSLQRPKPTPISIQVCPSIKAPESRLSSNCEGKLNVSITFALMFADEEQFQGCRHIHSVQNLKQHFIESSHYIS